MSLSRLLSFLAIAFVVQTQAHGDHDAPNPNGGSLRTRSGRLFPRSFNVQCSRPQADLDLINTEFTNAGKIATFAQQNLDGDSASTYTSAFIPKSLLDAGITSQLKDSYGNAANMPATSPANDYKLQVTCDNTKSFCTRGYYASMSDSTHTMNLCDAWFDVAGTPAANNLISTSDLLAGCTGDSPTYANLQDFWLGRAQSLLHEWTHTTYFTGTSERTIDYAYGVQLCLDLAAGSRKMPASREKDTKGNPICPDKDDPTEPGLCDPNFAIDNADTLAIIAGGLWYSDTAQCNRAIPIGLTAAPPPSRKRQAPDGEFTALDPPFDGDGFDPGSCAAPVNNCCGECSGGSTPTSASSSQPASITPGPTPSCTLQEEDPDQGINTPGCVCSGTTFPVLTGPSVTNPDASCAYTAFPTGSAEPSVTHPVTTTNCQVCTLVSNEEDNCTPLPSSASCTPTSATPPALSVPPTASPSTVVQLSNNSVHVGELSGSALYSQSWSALHPICPDVPAGAASTACDSSAQPIISNIGTTIGSFLEEGEITFTIEDSQYSSNDQRDAMLGAGLQAFTHSATGKNCGPVDWAEQSGEPCPNESRKRTLSSSPHSLSPAGNSLDPRSPEVMPPAYICHGTITVCNAANLITVELNTPGHPEAAHMNIEVGWQLEGGDNAFLDFLCEIAIAGLDGILAEAAPEVAPEAWVELGELLPCCEGQCVGSSTQDTPQRRRDLARGFGYGQRVARKF